MKRLALMGMVVGVVAGLTGCEPDRKYPVAPKGEVVDNYFGHAVADPYRWMENDTTAEVKAWVEAENAYTEAYLEKIPFRKEMEKRLESLVNYDVETAPFYTGKYYLYFRKEGLSNQSVLYVKDSLSASARVLLDPNTLSSDGTVALADVSVSHDSKYLAYSIADGGSDWRTIHVLEIATGEKLSDELHWVKFSAMSWKGNGFYYSAYDAPEGGRELSAKNEFHKVYYHELGTPQEADRLIYENRNYPLRNYVAQVTDDEKYLFISETESTDGNSLYFKNLETNGAFVRLTVGFDYDYRVIGSQKDSIYILTNYKAPRYRLVRMNMDQTDIGSWVDVIPEEQDVLSDCSLAKGCVVAVHMVDASSRMSIYGTDGVKKKDIELGVLGSVEDVNSRESSSEVFFRFASYTVPSVVYLYDVESGDLREEFCPKMNFDFSNYTVEQVFYESKDETRVPMFIVHRKDIELNGKNPTLLYGYGGFNISLTPYFSAMRLAWLEQGGVYAVANLRGGGEYGDSWHMSGTKLNKQNVFDDFIAAAEYLQDKQFTSPKYLAIQGGSNGGLLIGACVNQRPELFAVAVPQVGVMDMLRYQHFTIGWAWAGDYGTSDEEGQVENLLSYSPLHNIKRGGDYPAVLVTTADHDDRVVPAHSFKYIATLQELQPSGTPKLIRIETRAGHGAGKPTALAIQECADIYSFILYNMGFTPRYGDK